MADGVSRPLWKWILSLSLSLTVKHARRDFANGYLIAEILAKYFPRDIFIHSFRNGSSNETKMANWKLLSKFFQKHDVFFTQKQIQDTMDAQPKAAVYFLESLHDWLHGKSTFTNNGLQKSVGIQNNNTDNSSHENAIDTRYCTRPSFSMDHSIEAQLSGATALKQQPPPYISRPGRQIRGGIDWGTVIREPEKLHFVEKASLEGENPFPFEHEFQGLLEEPLERRYNIVPSQIDSFEDYRSQKATSFRSLPALKQAKSSRMLLSKSEEYWELGNLGPDMSNPNLIHKQASKARNKEFSERVREINKSIKQRQKKGTTISTEEATVSTRTRALLYSKSIHRPPASKGLCGSKRQEDVLTELERLEKEHEEHKKRIEEIANEMKRRGI